MRKRIGNLEFDRASHNVYHLTVHLVFCTTFRRHTLTAERLDFVNRSIRRIAEELNCKVIEFGGESDHIHFLLRYPPTAKLSDVVGTLRSKSASAVLNQFGSVYRGKHTGRSGRAVSFSAQLAVPR